MVSVTDVPIMTALHTLFTAKRNSDFVFHGESHHFWELVCVLEGRAEITADNRVLRPESPAMVLHRPMEFHKIRTLEAPLLMTVISFEAENMPDAPGTVYPLSPTQLQQLEELKALASCAFEFRSITACSCRDMPAARRFSVLLASFLLSVTHEQPSADEFLYEGDTAYSEIVAALELNLSRPLTLEELAKQCNRSVSSLKKIFHRYTGMGVMAYFTSMKLRHAQALLREGHSVKDTAALLGFSSPAYFSTVYRKFFGVSPTGR